jgi:hypothetical protein
MERGYIKLWRCLADNAIWKAETFTRGQAWIDVLILASHKPTSNRIRGILFDIESGQLLASSIWLAERWQWSRGKVERFLNELETRQQIRQQKNNVSTLITVLNWDQYQGNGTADKTANGHQTGSKRTPNGHIQEGKEGKELKEEQHNEMCIAKRFTPPTLEMVTAYCQQRKNSVDSQRFVDYYTGNGWKVGRNPMKDWQATVRTWERNSQQLQQPAGDTATEEAEARRLFGM